MKPIELHHKDGRTAGVWYCGECRIVHRDQFSADRCCAPTLCRICQKDTGDKYYLLCPEHKISEEVRKEAERFEKAEKLTEWDGPVYVDGIGYRDGYFNDVSDLLDYLADEDEGGPRDLAYAWTCNTEPCCGLDIDRILEDATQEAHEDFSYSDLDGIPELKAAIDKFNELNAGQVSWNPNFKRAVLLPTHSPKIATEGMTKDSPAKNS